MEADFLEVAKMVKLLNKFRLQLLRYVNEHRNTTVNGICEGLGRKQSVVSVNLCKMHRAGVLERTGDGTKGYYRVSKGFKNTVDRLHSYLHTDFDYVSPQANSNEGVITGEL
jgi:predicted transcriptional regulator